MKPCGDFILETVFNYKCVFLIDIGLLRSYIFLIEIFNFSVLVSCFSRKTNDPFKIIHVKMNKPSNPVLFQTMSYHLNIYF